MKERFITPVPPGTPQIIKMDVKDKTGNTISVNRKRIFVPSSVFDNKELLKNDPNYLANLAMLPEAKKKALLYGDWDSYEGQVFTEFKDNPDGYNNRLWTHVINPFEIPDYWKRYRTFDYGYTKPFAVQWWAVDYDGRAYLYRQLYGCTDTANTGLKLEPSEIARKIREIEDEKEKGHTIYGIADPAIWDGSHGTDGTIITLFEREGIYFEKGKNTRLSGLAQCHYRMAFDENGKPMMYVFKTCRPFIRTIPNLVYDENHVEDVNTDCEDHDYDAMRYFFMANPIATEKPKKSKEKPYNPLD